MNKSLPTRILPLLTLCGFILATPALSSESVIGAISGEGFVTSVNPEEGTISIDGTKYQLDPEVELKGFSNKKKSRIFPLKKGDTILFRLDSSSATPTIVEIWNQQE